MSKYFRNFIDVQSMMPEEEQTATTQQITNRKTQNEWSPATSPARGQYWWSGYII